MSETPREHKNASLVLSIAVIAFITVTVSLRGNTVEKARGSV